MTHVRSRGDPYPDGLDIDPEWTQGIMADVNLLALEPDPKSRMGASRFSGRSRAAGRVLPVIALRLTASFRRELGAFGAGIPRP